MNLRRHVGGRGVEQASGARTEESVSTRSGLVALASVFIALALVATFSSQPGRYVADARLEHVTAPAQYLARHAYLWDDARSLGKPTSHFSPATSAVQTVAAGAGAPPWAIERLTHALYLSLAALGVIVLLRAFHPRIGLAHGVAAFVYTFSPFTSQFLLPSGLFLAYALAPWFAWIALRGVRDSDEWRWAAAFALAAASFGALNAASLGFALIPAALMVIYLSISERRGFAGAWRFLWRAGLLSALTCSAAIVVLVFSAEEIRENLRLTELPETVARTSSWAESWRGLGFWLTYFNQPSLGGLLRPQAAPFFTSPALIAASFVAPVGALLVLALGQWRYRLLFGSMLLVSLVLMVGQYGIEGPSPFGQVLSFGFDHSDFIRGFRATYKAGAGFMLAVAVLLAIGLTALVGKAPQAPGDGPSRVGARPGRRPPAVGLAVAVVVLGVVAASFPFWTGRLYADDETLESIPQYWTRAFKYLDAQEQPGRVLVLPGSSRARYRWGYVNDTLFDGLSPLSPLRYNSLPEGTAESADLVGAIDEYAASPGYVDGTLAPILARLGVRWVLLQNDLNWQRMRVPRPSAYDRLRADPGLKLAATFGYPGLYTAGAPDFGAGLLGERSLPPVELYEVRGDPSPQPKLAAGPPVLVAGAGDSWPSLAAAGLLGGPPVAYTADVPNEVLEGMIASGAELVVTDGNRRRVRNATTGRPQPSPTLAAGEPTTKAPDDLFGSLESQSLAAYADAVLIAASRYGDPLAPAGAARPASAVDRVERTAWTLSGVGDPTGESLTVRLREPETVDAISVLPRAQGARRIEAVDVIAISESGGRIQKRLRFDGDPGERSRVRVGATGVSAIELRIARVRGKAGSVGIAEAEVMTPGGRLDLREFVRTPDDLAVRAASDDGLGAALAAHPPRYELRRVTGVGLDDEETELRREIFAFGDHRYELDLKARIADRAADSAIDAILGARVGAAGTSRFAGDLGNRGGLVVDDDLSTAWEPEPGAGERVDLRFPETKVRRVEVLVVSGSAEAIARSRVTDVDVSVGDDGTRGSSRLPRRRRCAPGRRPTGGCLEKHVVKVAPTVADRLSVTLSGIEPEIGPYGELPASVAEVRINGAGWKELRNLGPPKTCAPLLAVDGRPVDVQLPPKPDALAGRLLELKGCGQVRLGPGPHRIETRSGLSGAVLTASLVPRGMDARHGPPAGSDASGTLEVVGRSPSSYRLLLDAPEGALLIGGMPWHRDWSADSDELVASPFPLDTFAAWGVERPIAGPVALEFGPQRIYELAIALSVGGAAWCLWRITRRRERKPT